VDPSANARLAVDIGGTFTDVVLELPAGGRVTAVRKDKSPFP